jgi:hypothetical protein
MVRKPLQHRIGQNHVERPVGAPIAQVGDLKVNVGYALARRFDHVRRRVDADDERSRIAFAQNLGRVTRAAAKVNAG